MFIREAVSEIPPWPECVDSQSSEYSWREIVMVRRDEDEIISALFSLDCVACDKDK